MTAPPMPPMAKRQTAIPMPPARVLPRYASGGVTEQEKTSFVNSMWPYALRWSQQTGIPPEIFVGIGISETNWGRAGGFFGIKGSSPKGKSANYATFEYDKNGNRYDINDQFAVYDNADEGFNHFMSLVSSPGSRYEGAWKRFQQNGDVGGFLNGLVSAGYATDKNWPNNILALGRQAKAMADPNVQAAAEPRAGRQASPVPEPDKPVTGATTQAVQPVATPVDNRLQTQFDDVDRMLTAQRNRYNTLLTKPDKTRDELIEIGNLESSLPILRSQWMDLFKATQPAPDNEATTLNARTQAFNARQNAQTNSLQALAQVMDLAFKGRESESTFLFNFMNQAYTQAVQKYNAALQKGELDLAGYQALVTAQAQQQTAEAARAMNALAMAQAINKNDWAMAQSLLPKDSHFQPGFAPGDPMNVMLKQLGLGQSVIETVPVDTAKLDLRNTIRETDPLMAQMGYNRPNFAVDQVAQQAEANRNIGDFTGQPITTESFQQAGGQFPKAPDYTPLQQFLSMTIADIQQQPQWWNQQPATQVVNSSAGTPTGTAGHQAAPIPQQAIANTAPRQDLVRPTTATSTVGPYRFNPANNSFTTPFAPTQTAPSGTVVGSNPVPQPFAVNEQGQVVYGAAAGGLAQPGQIDGDWADDPRDPGIQTNRLTGQRRVKPSR